MIIDTNDTLMMHVHHVVIDPIEFNRTSHVRENFTKGKRVTCVFACVGSYDLFQQTLFHNQSAYRDAIRAWLTLAAGLL